MADSGKSLVGRKTNLVTEYGRPVYETDDGRQVSEISATFPYKGKFVNVPSIHGGVRYTEDELVEMLDNKEIKVTSTHSSMQEAEEAAKARSDNMKVYKTKAAGGVMMAQQGQTVLPMTQATSAPQGGGPKAANPAAVNPLVAPQQQSARPGEVDPRDGAVQEVAQEMQKRQAPPRPAMQQVGQEMIMSPPAQPQIGGLAAPAQPMAPPMMAKGGMKDDAPEGLAVMIGLGAPTPSYEEAAEGNPPPGATKEEVADDQLVLLSEGELVVPANVVRYHGLGAYEGMRREALMGLQEMENSGQIEYVSGGKEKADPIDDDGGLVKAQAGTTLMGSGLPGRLPSNPNEEVQLIDPIFTVPEAASSRFVTTPGQQRGIASPTTDTTPLNIRNNLPEGAKIDPVTGLIIYPGQPTPTTQGAGITSIVAPNVGQYTQSQDPDPAPDPAPAPDPEPAPAPASAPQVDSGSDDKDANAPNITASSAHGYQNVKTDLTGLVKGIFGPAGNLFGANEGTKEDVYGKVAVGTGAVYGQSTVPGADGQNVAQGHNPITGQRMPVFSDRPSMDFLNKSVGKGLGLKGSEDFRPFNEPLDYNEASPLGKMGIASTLDKAISNTKGFNVTAGDGFGDEAAEEPYEQQNITAEMLGFDKSKASYSLAANNSGKIGNDKGDIVATSTSVGVLNDSNQIETAQGTVVQVTFKDGTKGNLLGTPAANKTIIERYNDEKGYRESGVGYSIGQVDPRLSDAVQRQNQQTNELFQGSAQESMTTDAQAMTADANVGTEPMTPAERRDAFGVTPRKVATQEQDSGKKDSPLPPERRETPSTPEPKQDSDSGGGGGGGKIVCTEMYRQTQLEDWARTMKIWDTYQKRYLTPIHEVGYHWLFKPYVRGMQNSGILTNVGAFFAQKRTQHLKHVLTKGRAKDSFVGNVWCKIIHPIVYLIGKMVYKK